MSSAASSSLLSLSRWCVLGDVLNVAKPASRIVSRLREHGKEVQLVNPRAATVNEDGSPLQAAVSVAAATSSPAAPVVFPSLTSAFRSSPFAVLDLVINPVEGLKQLSALPPSTPLSVFIQPGAASEEIKQLCKERGWTVQEGCVLIELPSRL
jgi:predicted CoA-binding protein